MVIYVCVCIYICIYIYMLHLGGMFKEVSTTIHETENLKKIV